MFQERSGGEIPIPREASLDLLKNVTFGPPAGFFKLHGS